MRLRSRRLEANGRPPGNPRGGIAAPLSGGILLIFAPILALVGIAAVLALAAFLQSGYSAEMLIAAGAVGTTAGLVATILLYRQIKQGLDRLTGDQIGLLVIAYEPVWAIGTGRNATAAQAGEAHAHIRTRLRQWFGSEPAELCHVLYGGSVKPENIADLIAQPDVDGALVGGASLDVRSFVEIVNRSRQAGV